MLNLVQFILPFCLLTTIPAMAFFGPDSPLEEWAEDRLADLGYDTDFTPDTGSERKEDTKGFIPDSMAEEFAEELIKRGTSTVIPGGIDIDLTPDSKEK